MPIFFCTQNHPYLVAMRIPITSITHTAWIKVMSHCYKVTPNASVARWAIRPSASTCTPAAGHLTTSTNQRHNAGQHLLSDVPNFGMLHQFSPRMYQQKPSPPAAPQLIPSAPHANSGNLTGHIMAGHRRCQSVQKRYHALDSMIFSKCFQPKLICEISVNTPTHASTL